MNFFSSDAYLQVVAEVFFPGRPYHIGIARAKDRCFRTLLLEKPKEVMRQVPFLDFFESPAAPAEEPVAIAKGLVPMSTRFVTAEQWHEQGLEEHYSPAPQVQWRQFDDWKAFLAFVKARSPFPFNVSKRKLRKLGRELGEVSFRFHDPAPEVLAQCMRWKSDQYLRTGLWDLFASKRNVELFEELNRRQLLTTTTLRADTTLLGAHIGVLHEGRFYSWVPAYDPDCNKYSPGTLLFDYLLEESYQQKHEVFDFLIGNEPYKWNYATHAHVVESYGTPGLRQRIYQPLRDAVVDRLRGDNAVYRTLQTLKKRALEYRLRRE